MSRNAASDGGQGWLADTEDVPDAGFEFVQRGEAVTNTRLAHDALGVRPDHAGFPICVGRMNQTLRVGIAD